jgi:restriction system protein
MAKSKDEGAQFVQYFGPVLDALRALGGSGKPDEVVARIAEDLDLSDEIQNEALPSGELRYRNQVHWARFYLVREGLLDRHDAESGVLPSAVLRRVLLQRMRERSF